MKCEKCGTEMKQYINGSSRVNECPNCKWGWATSYIEPIYEDDTLYSIIIEQNNDVNAKSITEIKRYTNLTNSEIINILKNGNFVLVQQKAADIKNVIERLNNLNIKYTVEPQFKW